MKINYSYSLRKEYLKGLSRADMIHAAKNQMFSFILFLRKNAKRYIDVNKLDTWEPKMTLNLGRETI